MSEEQTVLQVSGGPIEVSVFAAKSEGEINIIWLNWVFDKENIHYKDLAKSIYKVTGGFTKWIKCTPIMGDVDDWRIDSIEKLKSGQIDI